MVNKLTKREKSLLDIVNSWFDKKQLAGTIGEDSLTVRDLNELARKLGNV